MAKKKINKPLASPPSVAPVLKDVKLPYALRRELEEITKQTGITFDLNAPISELEDICNNANSPRDSWRNRWH